MYEFDPVLAKDGCVVCFFDVDGTLTHRAVETGTFDGGASEPVERAIREFAGAGNVAMLSTGRSPEGVNADLAALPFAGAIFLGGAYVRVGADVVVDGALDPELALTVMRECEECGAAAAFADAYQSRVLSPTPGATWASPLVYTSVEDLLGAGDGFRTYKVNFIEASDFERWRERSSVVDEFTALDAGGDAWELVLRGISKAAGARAAMEALGVSPSLSVAIGDSANDVGLFEACQVSFAMGDADEGVRLRATHVTGDVDHDGVADALRALEPYWRR